jgi:aerobic-type carbon monoxide dehydrogenase small subunit (CoxS/CutS family)
VTDFLSTPAMTTTALGGGGFGTDEPPRASYTLRVNGVDRPVTDAWIGESLLYVLRERLGLAGAKGGCDQGECGACSVQLDGQLTAACLVPAALAADSEIRTVEGLADDGTASDVQRALAESGAVQCGYCVPGLAMAVHDLLERNHQPTELETREALCGNLCRCTGYRGALAAVQTVAQARAEQAEADSEQAEADAAGASADASGADAPEQQQAQPQLPHPQQPVDPAPLPEPVPVPLPAQHQPAPYQEQPYPDQAYPEQGYPDQPYPDQSYPDRAYPEQPYPDRAYPEQPYHPEQPAYVDLPQQHGPAEPLHLQPQQQQQQSQPQYEYQPTTGMYPDTVSYADTGSYALPHQQIPAAPEAGV